MDLYLFNTIINTIWYLFTILFVLYRFTSFFSYIYNFSKFCYKLWNGIVYIVDQLKIYLRKRKGYIYLENDDKDIDLLLPDQHQHQQSIIVHVKNYISNTYKNITGFFKPKIINSTSTSTHIAHDSIFNKSIDHLSQSQQERSKQQEAMFFSTYFKNLQQSNISTFTETEPDASQPNVSFGNGNNSTFTSNNSNLDKQYFNQSSYNKFQSIPLVSPSDYSTFAEHDLFDPLISSYINHHESIQKNNNIPNLIDTLPKANSNMLFDSHFINDNLFNNTTIDSTIDTTNDTTTNTINNDSMIDSETNNSDSDSQDVRISINSYIQPIDIKSSNKKQKHHISHSVINTHLNNVNIYSDPYDDEITKNPYI